MEQSTTKSSSGGKFLGVLVVLALIVLVVVLDMKRREAETMLQELSVKYEQQAGNPAQGREVAKQVVEKVKKLIRIPAGVEPTVATIVDVNQLRQRNAFYSKAKNGDNLIVTNDRAILYDPVANIIIDVVPVQIQAPAANASAPGGSKSSVKAPAAGTKSSK